jgi:hypothetical protein
MACSNQQLTRKGQRTMSKQMQAHIRAEKATLKRHGTTVGHIAEDTYKRFYLYYLSM